MTNGRITPHNLDDRKWDDIVEETKGLIPQYCPEWTDHNPSDLGITLIELFAWMAEMIIYRLNQVPEKNYIAFLNLLNITRDPPTPATVELSFEISADSVPIPKGTQVSTEQTEQEEAVVFETDEDHTLSQGLTTIKATNALTINVPERLGVSSGEAFQVFQLRNAPLYPEPDRPDPFGHLQISVGGVFWTRVDELQKGMSSSYRCNPVTGEIVFGNDQFGGVPGTGLEIKAESYRYTVGGFRSNVPANTLILLKTHVDGIDSVTNPAAASGGTEWEPVEETMRRAPQEIKSQDRAVTAEDYEFLAKEATTDVAKVRCLGPKKIPGGGYEESPVDRRLGKANIILVSNVPFDPEDAQSRNPALSDDVKDQIERYLDTRRVLTSELFLLSAAYVEIAVEATLYVPADQDTDETKQAVLANLQRFLHPVSGGPDGKGWEIGEDLYIPRLFDVLLNIKNVSYVETLQATAKRGANVTPAAGVRVAIEEHEIVCAAPDGDFEIEVIKEEAEL